VLDALLACLQAGDLQPLRLDDAAPMAAPKTA
jgi:hypothetical protein